MVWIGTEGLCFPLQYGLILINWQGLMRTYVQMYQSNVYKEAADAIRIFDKRVGGDNGRDTQRAHGKSGPYNSRNKLP